jgi:cell division protein FtsN
MSTSVSTIPAPLITSTTPITVAKKVRKPRVKKEKVVAGIADVDGVDGAVIAGVDGAITGVSQPDEPVAVAKAKRAPSAYNVFVKEHYAEFKDIPTKERFGKLSTLWAEEKAKRATQ